MIRLSKLESSNPGLARLFLALLTLISYATGEMVAQQPSTTPGDKPVAIVNGEAILWRDLQAALQRLPPPPQNWTEERRKLLEREVLALLIDEALIKQYAARHFPAPDEATLQKRLADLQTALQARGQTLEGFLKESGISPEKLKQEIAALERVRAWDQWLRQQIKEEHLRAYYEANKEMFDGVVIRASHIALRVPPNADDATRQKIATQLQAIRQEIANGLPFAEAAKKYSQDPSSALGGDLGYFPPRTNDTDPFIRTASRLKVGEISEVVHTEFGCHLITVTDRKPGKPTTFEQVRDIVLDVYVEEVKARVLLEERKKAKVEVLIP
ncbi:MAG: peptidylprolyl isomerase [Gemmatales bacterium]|nr:peptidylprolyl isomerase [Gemmatales bacterium]MDW7993956.1 peptidylprolyl isomerase [Gemmatales bacterium]